MHGAQPVDINKWLSTTEQDDDGAGSETKYITFKVDPDGAEGYAQTDESEVETLLRAAMTQVEAMGDQNKELHETILDLVKTLAEAALPYKDALHEMGSITSNAYYKYSP